MALPYRGNLLFERRNLLLQGVGSGNRFGVAGLLGQEGCLVAASEFLQESVYQPHAVFHKLETFRRNVRARSSLIHALAYVGYFYPCTLEAFGNPRKGRHILFHPAYQPGGLLDGSFQTRGVTRFKYLRRLCKGFAYGLGVGEPLLLGFKFSQLPFAKAGVFELAEARLVVFFVGGSPAEAFRSLFEPAFEPLEFFPRRLAGGKVFNRAGH